MSRRKPSHRKSIRRNSAVPPSRPERRAWLEEKAPLLRFALRFVAILGGFYAISFLPPCQEAVEKYLHGTAWLGNGLLNAMGQESRLAGASIWSPGFSVTVTEGCSALEFVWFLAAAILAFPGPWVRKLTGVALGFVVIGVLNVVRVVSLYLVGVHSAGAFTVVHEDAWPALLILATLVLMAAWIAWAGRPDHLENHAAA